MTRPELIPSGREFTVSQAADILEMSRPSLKKLIRSGRIASRKVGRHHRISATAIEAFQQRQADERAAAETALARFANRAGQLD